MNGRDEVVAASRTLWRSPRFALFSTLVLTFAITANTVLFSVADAVVLRPFPFSEPDRLIVAGENLIPPRSEISYRDFIAWRDQARTFDGAAAIGSSNWSWRLRTTGESVEVRYRVVSGTFFDLLGAAPLLGRTLRAADDTRGAPRTTVLSYGTWQRVFGGDPGIV